MYLIIRMVVGNGRCVDTITFMWTTTYEAQRWQTPRTVYVQNTTIEIINNCSLYAYKYKMHARTHAQQVPVLGWQIRRCKFVHGAMSGKIGYMTSWWRHRFAFNYFLLSYDN